MLNITPKKNIRHCYFECTSGSGSFVKSENISGGCDLLSALEERYYGDLLEDHVIGEMVTIRGNTKQIAFIGEDNIRFFPPFCCCCCSLFLFPTSFRFLGKKKGENFSYKLL